jgi:probable rRNA maturation factor
MILIDPDLDPDPALASPTAKQTPASGPSTPKKNLRLPSARTLARFLGLAQGVVRIRGEVTVLLTTDTAIRRLNRQFRGKNQATDVLSFPAEGMGAEEMAGDLAISVLTATRQAVEQGHSLATEIKVLILHGLLHLAGYDHEADAGKMARREGLLRARLGLPQGLIERAIQPKLSVRKHATESGKAAVLKGHGFSRAAKTPKKAPALAAAGRSAAAKVIPQRLKPNIPVAGVAARLKSCPFKARMNEVRGIPHLPQKQVRGKDGAPSIVGTPDAKRGLKP